MFKIDLLEGQGIPIRSTPAGLIIAAAMSSVPVIVFTTSAAASQREKALRMGDLPPEN